VSRRGLARLNAKRDANERLIIEALEARGYSVTQLNGRGVPDLLVGKRGDPRMWLVEVKRPKKGFTPAQNEWRAKWMGPAPITLRTVDEALTFPEVA
jgi:hypothetical protein